MLHLLQESVGRGLRFDGMCGIEVGGIVIR
jgi:hypothetical protein